MVTSAAACAAAAGDLTELTWRLLQVHDTLTEQVQTSAGDFGGVSGEAYRVHASHSAAGVAGLASDVALLAGALAALGRELADVAELRALAEGLPADAAAEARRRADRREERAQAGWRTAAADFQQRRGSVGTPVQAGLPEPPSQVGPASSAAPPGTAAPRRAPPTVRGPDPLEAEIVGATYDAQIVRPGGDEREVGGR